MENSIERMIADEIISQLEGQDGDFEVELEVEEYTISVSGVYEIYGHHQWDCDFGPGEWVADSAWCNILRTETYNEEGKELKNIFSTSEVERIVEKNFK